MTTRVLAVAGVVAALAFGLPRAAGRDRLAPPGMGNAEPLAAPAPPFVVHAVDVHKRFGRLGPPEQCFTALREERTHQFLSGIL